MALIRGTTRTGLALPLVMVLVACDIAGLGVDPTLPPNVVPTLVAQGFAAQPTDPPPDAVAPSEILAKAGVFGAASARSFYLLLTCPEGRECRSWSGWMPRQPAGAWVFVFTDQEGPDGSVPWSLYEADTGEFVTSYAPAADDMPGVSAAPLP